VRLIRCKVVGSFDRCRAQQATVTINRGTGVVSVRIYRQRREYHLPLATVAAIVVERNIKAEVARQRLERARKVRVQRGLKLRLGRSA
jgi:hypothetical protein